MKRSSLLLLVALALPACTPSAEWGPGLGHWSNPNPKKAPQSAFLEQSESTPFTEMTAETEDSDYTFGNATESDSTGEMNATTESTSESTFSNATESETTAETDATSESTGESTFSNATESETTAETDATSESTGESTFSNATESDTTGESTTEPETISDASETDGGN